MYVYVKIHDNIVPRPFDFGLFTRETSNSNYLTRSKKKIKKMYRHF